MAITRQLAFLLDQLVADVVEGVEGLVDATRFRHRESQLRRPIPTCKVRMMPVAGTRPSLREPASRHPGASHFECGRRAVVLSCDRVELPVSVPNSIAGFTDWRPELSWTVLLCQSGLIARSSFFLQTPWDQRFSLSLLSRRCKMVR